MKVYQDTQRPFWDNHGTTLKFLLTSVILGFATILLTTLVWGAYARDPGLWGMTHAISNRFLRIILAATVLKLLFEAGIFLHLLAGQLSFIKKTAILMTHHLKNYTIGRWVCGIIGGILLPLIFIVYGHAMPVVVTVSYAVVVWMLVLAGEFLERYLFFRAVVPLKMPGEKIC